MDTATAVREILELAPLEAAFARARARGAKNEAAVARLTEIEAELVPEVAAGLWILLDGIDRAHEIVQSRSTRLAFAWHAVVHRREGDYSNALHWWNRAGDFGLKENPRIVAESSLNERPGFAELERQEWAELMELSKS